MLDSIDHFSYVTSTVVTPMFLLAGTYFPIDEPLACGGMKLTLQM